MERNIRKYGKKRKKPFRSLTTFTTKTKRIPENRRCCRRRTSGKRSHSKYESLYLALQVKILALFRRAVESHGRYFGRNSKEHQISREYLWKNEDLESI
ncbi:Uncharacterised protein [Fusobacterium necrophorum subsp. necrophorum]|nr:Uncharacterised protein [Fusobacterium necrophorum subsp. necrophorum]